MLRTTATALFLTACLAAFVPTASANHTRCDNEAEDVFVPGFLPVEAGIDGPLLDGNGIQVCINTTVYSVESNVRPPGWDGVNPPPADSVVVVRACTNTGSVNEECDESRGGTVILDWTGVALCGTTCARIYVDGTPL